MAGSEDWMDDMIDDDDLFDCVQEQGEEVAYSSWHTVRRNQCTRRPMISMATCAVSGASSSTRCWERSGTSRKEQHSGCAIGAADPM